MDILKTAILVPCYKRPDYTNKCLRSLEHAQEYPNTTFLLIDDGSNDETAQLLMKAKLPKEVIIRDGNMGLRATLLEFIRWACEQKADILGVIGNDCLVPKNFLNDILLKLVTTDADILSPNVYPSNAAFLYGTEDIDGKGYRPAKLVGGLWFLRRQLIEDIAFEDIQLRGIAGAFNIIERVILEKDPKVGWLPGVVVHDLGHWSGMHPEHIKSEEHRAYSEEVGRGIKW